MRVSHARAADRTRLGVRLRRIEKLVRRAPFDQRALRVRLRPRGSRTRRAWFCTAGRNTRRVWRRRNGRPGVFDAIDGWRASFAAARKLHAPRPSNLRRRLRQRDIAAQSDFLSSITLVATMPSFIDVLRPLFAPRARSRLSRARGGGVCGAG
jgi:hypothetical protein